MPLTYQVNFLMGGLQPLFPGEEKFVNIGLKVSSTFVQGTVMGELTVANDVQTITGTASGGTFTITVTIPGNAAVTTAALAYDIPTATLQTTLRTLVAGLFYPGTNSQTVIGSTGFTVSGSAGTSYVITAAGNLVSTFLPIFTLGVGSLTGGTATIAHTTKGIGRNTFAAYASGNTDGSQTPKCILAYDAVTDANGNITLGDQSGGGDHLQTQPIIPAFIEGTFSCADLTGLDATAVAGTTGIAPLGRLLEGSVTAGIFRMP